MFSQRYVSYADDEAFVDQNEEVGLDQAATFEREERQRELMRVADSI